MDNEPGPNSSSASRRDADSAAEPSGDNAGSFSASPRLRRGFDSYVPPAGYHNAAQASYPAGATGWEGHRTQSRPDAISKGATSQGATSQGSTAPSDKNQSSGRSKFAWLMPWRAKQTDLSSAPSPTAQTSTAQTSTAQLLGPSADQGLSVPTQSTVPQPRSNQPGFYRHVPNGIEGISAASEYPYGTADVYPPLAPPVPPVPRFWQKQPFVAIAYFSLIGTALSTAWLFGILAAQIVPGRFENPPVQESFLRKSSRLTRRLWHFSELWQTPTTRTRIEAIPLPETGPILGPIELSPIERQPLIDELNAVETEILTLDRRLQGIEKRLGKLPYQGTDVQLRINALRAAIDPPARPEIAPSYEPAAADPSDVLLEVAALSITLPSDALFAPGGGDLKAADLLQQVRDQLVNYPDSTVSIRSYSDDQFDAIASREYTLTQANAIARYLSQSLPGNYRWITVGMGQAQAVTDNKDVVARQKNRRIEILVDVR